jgi:hypothetical protein
MYQIAWLNARPYCWAASVNGGKTYELLHANNDEDSSEAVDEAAARFAVATDKWDLLDDPITSLTP